MTVIDLASSMKITPPIANSKPASVDALEPLHIARSVGRIDRQFGVDALADIGRKLEPLTGRRGREGNRFHSYYISYSYYRGKRYIAESDKCKGVLALLKPAPDLCGSCLPKICNRLGPSEQSVT